MRRAIRRRNVLLEDLKLGVRYPRGQIRETQSSRTIRICTSDLPCISLPLFEPASEWPAFPLRFMTATRAAAAGGMPVSAWDGAGIVRSRPAGGFTRPLRRFGELYSYVIDVFERVKK
ncbi:predicted protein [Histoplasma mississippiense (nom. inval.)]|nr:predicted protein [Histoplasma mississippiense (nom. inval.)]EDN11079.1 predicted protein [Histoplasma mississippiense (nom. inval.)]